jgi:hypothetical protein
MQLNYYTTQQLYKKLHNKKYIKNKKINKKKSPTQETAGNHKTPYKSIQKTNSENKPSCDPATTLQLTQVIPIDLYSKHDHFIFIKDQSMSCKF